MDMRAQALVYTVDRWQAPYREFILERYEATAMSQVRPVGGRDARGAEAPQHQAATGWRDGRRTSTARVGTGAMRRLRYINGKLRFVFS